jgi:hypothetical protein
MKNNLSIFRNPGTINCDVLRADVLKYCQYLT